MMSISFNSVKTLIFTKRYLKHSGDVRCTVVTVVQCIVVLVPGASCHYYARFLAHLLPASGAGSAWRLITSGGTPESVTPQRAPRRKVEPVWTRREGF